jgi:hypothetical protein
MESVAHKVVSRWISAETKDDPSETTAELLAKIKKLDVQIKYSADIARRRQWIMSRNQMVGIYNKMTGKTPDRGVTQKL